MIGIFWVSVLFNAVSVAKGQLRSTNLRLDGYRLGQGSKFRLLPECFLGAYQ